MLAADEGNFSSKIFLHLCELELYMYIAFGRIEYPMIKEATHAGKCLFLTVFNNRLNGEDSVVAVRLVSQRAANALYRCVTEMHSFYRCDTVRNVVLDQYSRDLKGILASFFNENSTLG